MAAKNNSEPQIAQITQMKMMHLKNQREGGRELLTQKNL